MPNNSNHFKLEVDLNVINHLGVGLYSSTPAALTELVANAWDADANEVHITIDPENRTITIEDDGHGMDASGIKTKFLNVGYSRRKTTKGHMSDSGERRVMGRKGIGKLAMFALADMVKVSSQTSSSEIVGFEVDVPLLKHSLETSKSIELDEFEGEAFPKGRGTRIVLENVLSGLNTTAAYLRVKLARRFSILGDTTNFKVFLDNQEITKEDRGFYQHVQFLWAFDSDSLNSIKKLSEKSLASVAISDDDPTQKEPCTKLLPNEITFGETTFKVTGYVASVVQPKNLGSKEDSANIFSVFANGRVFTEDILSEANSAKYYQNYLVGEIHANFLDDDEVDRATASREAIKRDDPRYQALLQFVRSTLEDIGDQWDEWRTELGLDQSDPGNSAVNNWLSTLKDKRDARIAKRLITSIKNATIHNDESKNIAAKKILYRGAIIGFEKLKLRKQLDKLADVTDVLSAEFASIFSSLNEVEEAAYSEITKQRLEVIKKFRDIASDPVALEKVAQKYLFEHLWLLDPAWDRVTGRAVMEQTLTDYIKSIVPDSTGARVDISYRASSGRHIIVELKKPSLTTLNFDDLSRQTRKYRMALEEYYRTALPSSPIPPIDIYLLIAKTPTGFNELDKQSLAAQCGQIVTYKELITNAINTYQAYLDTKNYTGSLEEILNKI